uniref:Aminopeptidase n=1 Tax=Myripristis murdjan TaxID=586833 RepID=A0A667ZA41_9TELE
MAKGFYISKALAIVTVVLTFSAIAGIITMIIVYQTQTADLNMTPRPTIPVTTPFPPGPRPQMRLPGDLVPDHYELTIRPYLYPYIEKPTDENATSPDQNMTFTGNSTVYFHCVRRTKTVFLHNRGLTIGTVRLTDRDKNQRVPLNGTTQHRDESNFFEISVDEVLEVGGNYSLFTEFEGEMMDDLAGLYVSRYRDAAADGNSTERFVAATQMQPTDARKVFPCFDEPAMKATFDVKIIHRRGTEALANSQESDKSIVDEDWLVSTFHTTQKMSTYLLAFVVSEFQSTPSKHERVKILTYARPEAIAAGHADYAAEITGKILTFLEGHLEINFPQKKLDQVALPDFAAAAMENWGLVTYQESALLFENGVSSMLAKEWTATIIAHELAHQWFGNLVTMKWWNEIWLNEGFAAYMSTLAVDNIEPSWNIKDMLMMENLHSAFEWDALASSHPLSSPADAIQTPSEIIELFDPITYSKVKAEAWRRTHKWMYLKAFQYENTEQADLWKYLQKVNGKINVANVMDTWTNQIGYPVITINTTTGEAYQRHFQYNQSTVLVWHVPIKVMSETSGPTLFKEEFVSKGGEWILANVNAAGYYRVNYNPENWHSLLTALEEDPERIPIVNRGQLIDDAFNLARAKLVNVTLALNATRFLRNETELIPWESAVTNLRYIIAMFDRSEVFGPIQAYRRQLVTNLYCFFKNYTDNATVPEDHSQQHNQINAIRVACGSGLPECRLMATRFFRYWMQNGTNIIHPNVRSIIYCQAISAGGEEEWEFGWKMFQSSNITSDREQLRYALACTKKIWLLNRYLEYTLNPDKIRKMDAVSTINTIAGNVAGQALAWNFVRAHWTYISQEYGAGMMPLGSLIDGVTHRFSTDFELLERFQMDHDEEELGSANRAVEQAIERTAANIQWVKENKQPLLEWFQRESAVTKNTISYCSEAPAC